MINIRPTAVQTGIWGIGTARPMSITQAALTELAETHCCEEPGQRAWLRRVFSKCGVWSTQQRAADGRGDDGGFLSLACDEAGSRPDDS